VSSVCSCGDWLTPSIQDYQEHQNEIHAKLVAIMSDRLAVHCASLRVSLAISRAGDKQLMIILAV